MLFSSPTFLFIFLPIVFIIVQLVLKSIHAKNTVLFISSAFFYYWGEPDCLSLILFSIVLNYSIGYVINSFENKKSIQQNLLFIGVFINLLLLIYFKYYNFLLDSIPILKTIFADKKVALPLGISFFTFHGITYIVDIYRRKATAAKNPIEVGLYVLFFPQLIAGPIVRYQDINQQLFHREFSFDRLKDGVRRFIAGLFKKLIIANSLGYITDDILNHPMKEISPSLAWMAAICYAFQLFFDFSAYSDMAIGLAKMFGFEFLENFNYPYISRSIKEFWRRWHISLSTFFRDYVYIPLGGNQRGALRTILNLFIVFFLTGLWHGASFNFIVWGLYHGCFLVIERFVTIKAKNVFLTIAGHIYAMLVVVVGWVIFRVEKLEDAILLIKKMFYIQPSNDATFRYIHYLNGETVFILILAVLLSMPITQFIKNRTNPVLYSITFDLLLFVLFCWSMLAIAASSYNPFIYFRF